MSREWVSTVSNATEAVGFVQGEKTLFSTYKYIVMTKRYIVDKKANG